jgi:hypothetical protein
VSRRVGEAHLEGQRVWPSVDGVGGPVVGAEQRGPPADPNDVVIVGEELRRGGARAPGDPAFVRVFLARERVVARPLRYADLGMCSGLTPKFTCKGTYKMRAQRASANARQVQRSVRRCGRDVQRPRADPSEIARRGRLPRSPLGDGPRD